MKHTVTVIIPVLNAAESLENVLQALSRQTYSRELIEIIIVDNGSEDGSAEVVKSFGAKLLYETERKSPYAARNIGFQKASGSIIALTDANKVPSEKWIEEGVKAILENSADLVGGEITFDLGLHPKVAEIYDALTYNDNRTFVLENQSSAAGNLFFRREVIDQIGSFPDQFRSGMDIWWSGKAVKNGLKLVFAENAVVYCKPRKLKAILQKSWRVGTMHPLIFKENGHSIAYILGQTFRTFAPPKIHPLKTKVKQLSRKPSLFKIWCVAWMCRIMMGSGRIRGLTKLGEKLRTEP